MLHPNEDIYEASQLYDQITKIKNGNYAGDPKLIWGQVKV